MVSPTGCVPVANRLTVFVIKGHLHYLVLYTDILLYRINDLINALALGNGDGSGAVVEFE